MPLSALPKHLQDVENHFPDDEQFGTKTLFGKLYRWYQKKTKTWFCFSYRCIEWWARWRQFPFVLFAVGGDGPWRYESQDGSATSYKQLNTGNNWYLSRIQYYKRWHFAIQWPLMVSFHFYFKAINVPTPENPHPNTEGTLFYFYWNHFDNELIYWMFTSLYLGRNWK